MKTSTFIIICVLGFAIFSCKSESIDTLTVIPIEIQSDNLNIFEEKAYIKEIISTENSHPIGELSKSLYSDGKIFILDKAMDEILIFDNAGKYLSKISDKGNGPDEYIYIQNFYLSKSENTINVLSGDGKILSYNFNGENLKETGSDSGFEMVMDAEELPNGSIAFYGLGPSHNLYIKDTESNEGAYHISFIPDRDMSFSNKSFASVDTNTLFCFGMNDSIYQITTDNTILPKYYIDFGGNSIPSQLYLSNPDAVANLYEEKVLATKLDDLNQSNDYLTFSYMIFDPKNMMDVKTKYAVYEKKEGTVFNIPEETILFPTSDVIDENYFLSVIPPVQITTNTGNGKINKKLTQYIAENNISEEDNPLLVIWEIK